MSEDSSERGLPHPGGTARKAPVAATAILGHELRGPLGAISAIADLMLAGGSDGDQRHRAELIRLAAGHLASVTDHLVDEASLDAGRFTARPRTFSPAALVGAVAALHAPLGAGRDVAVTARVGAGTPERFVADETRIRQVLVNLVANALRATASGWISVEVRPSETGGLVFEVGDTGSGLPAATTGEPFQPGEGSGLGLWISGRIAAALGARLALAGKPGGGTVATLEVPRAETPAAPEPEPVTADARPVLSPSRLAGAVVLVVDDNAVMRELLATLLQSLDAVPVVAASGAEALSRAIARNPAVVLLDLSLGGEDGTAVARRFKRSFGGNCPPLVAVTGYAEAPAAGLFAGHLVKPFAPRELYDLVSEVLDAAG
jgi:CheY-like chemotaxis protein